eukprot:jgi/Mesvir1/28208/Mv04761-RA.1
MESQGDEDDKVATFAAVTGADEGTARRFLAARHWNLERAVDFYLENGGRADLEGPRRSPGQEPPIEWPEIPLDDRGMPPPEELGRGGAIPGPAGFGAADDNDENMDRIIAESRLAYEQEELLREEESVALATALSLKQEEELAGGGDPREGGGGEEGMDRWGVMADDAGTPKGAAPTPGSGTKRAPGSGGGGSSSVGAGSGASTRQNAPPGTRRSPPVPRGGEGGPFGTGDPLAAVLGRALPGAAQGLASLLGPVFGDGAARTQADYDELPVGVGGVGPRTARVPPGYPPFGVQGAAVGRGGGVAWEGGDEEEGGARVRRVGEDLDELPRWRRGDDGGVGAATRAEGGGAGAPWPCDEVRVD